MYYNLQYISLYAASSLPYSWIYFFMWLLDPPFEVYSTLLVYFFQYQVSPSAVYSSY